MHLDVKEKQAGLLFEGCVNRKTVLFTQKNN